MENKKSSKTQAPDNNNSELKVRMKVQEILQKNMRTPIGMFSGKELNERCFLNDLFKQLDIKIK